MRVASINLEIFSWEGNSLYGENVLQSALNLNKGDIFSQTGFDKAVFQDVQSLYMDRGYLYSNIEPFLHRAGKDSMDVHFSVTENNKVYVRNINIYGNSKTAKMSFVENLMYFLAICSEELFCRQA